MKRTLSTTACAAALLSLTACKKSGSADAAKLVPDAAKVIAGANLQTLMKSPLYGGNEEMLESGDQKEFVAAAKACDLGPDTWKSVVFGFDPDGGESSMALVLVAEGLGKKDNLECVSAKIEASSGSALWTMEEKDGRLVLDIQGVDATGYVVDDNTLAVAGSAWAGAVLGLIEGEGTSAIDHGLEDAVDRTDMSKAMWAAGIVPDSMQRGTTEGMTSGALWVDVSSGLEVMASVGVKDADMAETKAKEFEKGFSQLEGLANTFGVPASVTESVSIEAKGESINLSAKATKEDLEAINAALQKSVAASE